MGGATDRASDPETGLIQLIEAAREGDDAAIAALFSAAYEELHHQAHMMRRGEVGETLSTTALVHEAFLKLVPSQGLPVRSGAHFKHIAARAMRQVLVDTARKRTAKKRGGGGAIAVTLEDHSDGRPVDELQILQLEEALSDLERVDRRSAEVVECRFFGGLDVEETAAALDISTATVKRDWRVARAWLAQALS